ncbi:hypothetical protein GCM10011380_24190 [Sphingomonas metalli]|uniref:Uncharacterized protein n=1 Tax=Sphingomonas metalli TaxID=1779358 RepID=A0A916T6K5_9SPHN|nr:hypothetical protein [Sphingomonas metalli]GGB33880.1 hypothetical protein GCM10011380_24190 [Sphingomonas metalli]
MDEPGRAVALESDLRYYARRLSMERAAAERAVTAEARERRMRLVESYQRKLAALGG